jgi:hypothetical protein
VHGMPTLHGELSFSARTLDAQTFRFGVVPGMAARIELRPPLSGRLVGVSVNGSAHEDFDAQSAVITNTPAEIICHTNTSIRA